MIALTDILVVNDSLMMADLEGEAVLLDVESGRYFGLNEVGTSIWTMIKSPCMVSDIIEGLRQEYAAPAETLGADVLAFLQSMANHNLVHVITPAHV